MTTLQSITLAAVLTVASLAHAATPQPPKTPNIDLEMSCKLVRRYLDANGKVAMQDLTPATAKAQPVVINDLTATKPSMTHVKFTAPTPDGDVEVYAIGMATNDFGKSLSLQISHTAELKTLAVTMSDPRVFADPIPVNSASIDYKSTVRFSTGRTAEGFVVNEYNSVCAIKKVN